MADGDARRWRPAHRRGTGGRLEDLLDEVLDRYGRDAEDDIAVLASRIRADGPMREPAS
ncbi:MULTISPECIES: hypothetical protein [unclassified Streptomyces]|uniref:hypothetical protein n=1 Tax=unclassified Streptomyces TaxID=2593676 RepID=UPI0036FAB868